MEFLTDTQILAVAGALAGTVLGFTARTVRFCSLSAIESALYGRDFQLMRLWAVGIATAIIITQSLSSFYGLELWRSAYLGSEIPLLGLILGGLIFGLGMSLVGTCGLGSILRFGGGDLRGLVAMVMIGITGFMTMRGIFHPIKMAILEFAPIKLPVGKTSSLVQLISTTSTEYQWPISLAVSFGVAAILFTWAYSSQRFRIAKSRQLGGFVVGAVIGFGWYMTGVYAQDGFTLIRPSSITYVKNTGESISYLMNFTGLTINFGVASVFGTFVGALIASIKNHDFHWDSFDDAREMKRQMTGACMMGFGAVVASGCTIGQGMTGISTLSISSIIAFSSIIVGAAIGLKLMIDGGFDHIPFFR